MASLCLQNLHKSFGTTSALRGVSLEIQGGETIAFIGPSGCGKTTLLRCIALLETIDRGAIVLDGVTIIARDDEANSHRRLPRIGVNVDEYHARVGMVFQHLHLWPHLTVLQNLTLAARLVNGVPEKTAVEQAMALLQRMMVVDKASLYPAMLSGGQQQRVALARALMMKPEVLLLDEITSALDPELVGEILDVVAELAATGMTLLIVTHELFFAAEVAHRVVFLADGLVAEQGEPEQLFQRPQSERLKVFLERMSRHHPNGGNL